MGHIQNLRMERAKRAFKEEMFPSDKARAFYVDHAGNVMGFTMERENGKVLSYNGETGRYEPFEILPEDGAVNVPPYKYWNGKRVETDAQNTKIEYLYRDADNYKKRNECIVSGLLTAEQEQKILDCRSEGQWFIPHLVGLPEKQFDDYDVESDHPWFELYDWSFEATALPATLDMKADDLVAAFEACYACNWQEPEIKRPTLAEQISLAEEKRQRYPVPVLVNENER